MGDSFGQSRRSDTTSTSTTNNIVDTTNLNASGNTGVTLLGTNVKDLTYDQSYHSNIDYKSDSRNQSVNDSGNTDLIYSDSRNLSTNLSNSGNTSDLRNQSVNDSGNTSNLSYASDSRNLSTTTTDSHNVTNVTDFGAIQYGSAVAREGLDIVKGVTLHALDQAYATSDNALHAADNFTTNAEKFASGLTSQVISFVGTQASANATTLANTVSALSQITKEQNTSSDQRVADIASSAQASNTQVIKYIAIGAAVVGGLYFLSKSRAA